MYAQINISSAHVRKSWGTSWVKKEGSLEKSSKSAPSECWIIPSAPWRLDPPSEHQIRKGPCLNPRSPLRKRVKNPTETKVSGCVSLKNDRRILTQIHWIMITHSHHSPFKLPVGGKPYFQTPPSHVCNAWCQGMSHQNMACHSHSISNVVLCRTHRWNSYIYIYLGDSWRRMCEQIPPARSTKEHLSEIV